MLTSDRQNEIIKLTEQNGSVNMQQLMKLFDASESTIRRDLIFLDKEGKIKKVHGGASSCKPSVLAIEYDMDTKSGLNVSEKERIGKYAASLINDDDFVFIDAGSSTMHLATHISNSKATYVTNGVAHAKVLIKKGLKVYVIGGELKLSTEAIIGNQAVEDVEKYNFTKAFVGTNGVSISRGLSTPEIEEAMLKKRVTELSYVTFALADHSKFNIVSSVTFCKLNKVCLITDKEPGDEYKNTVYKVVPENFERT